MIKELSRIITTTSEGAILKIYIPGIGISTIKFVGLPSFHLANRLIESNSESKDFVFFGRWKKSPFNKYSKNKAFLMNDGTIFVEV